MEEAQARHLNTAVPSMYINKEGGWRLCGFKKIWESKVVAKVLLDLTKTYKKMETTLMTQTVIKNKFNNFCVCNTPRRYTPNANEFREYCSTH